VATFLAATFNTQMLLPTIQALDRTSDDIDIVVLDAHAAAADHRDRRTSG
jgi:hypothetical protein